MNAGVFDRLAALFAYPRGEGACGIQDLIEDVKIDWRPAADALAQFAAAVSDLTLEEHQELFVRTFEMNPVCSLEVGWQLFGEHYERGTFLVGMRQMMREFRLTESTELPDHLMHVLEILGRMPEGQAASFAAETLQPAVGKMHDSLREGDNPYRHLLRATLEVITAIARTQQEVDHGR